MHIISNFGIYEDDILTQFGNDIIHSLNKHDVVKHTYDKLFPQKSHSSAIILGDILEDSTMLSTIGIPTQLKVGFLNSAKNEEKQLPMFNEVYDMIILKDGNMWPLIQLLRVVTDCKEIQDISTVFKYQHYIDQFGS